ncbi:unnamed protein product, partial [Brassica oleracea]
MYFLQNTSVFAGFPCRSKLLLSVYQVVVGFSVIYI